jgi:hypothetical protein
MHSASGNVRDEAIGLLTILNIAYKKCVLKAKGGGEGRKSAVGLVSEN